jgi:tetratricopeptide (TPR) repeat protein
MKTSTQTVGKSAPTAARRRWLWGSLVGVGVVLGAGWFIWVQFAPVPPMPDLTGCDPEVGEAVAAARSDVRLWPWSAERWGRLGMLLLAHDQHRDALVCLARAEEYDPTDVRWPYYQGLIFILDNPEASLPCFQRAAARSADFAPRQRLAEQLLREDRLDDAEKVFRMNLAVREVAPHAALGLGQVALKRGDWKGGIGLLNQASASPAVRRLAYGFLATAHQHLGEIEMAAQLQKQAATLPEDAAWFDPYQETIDAMRVGAFGMMSRALALLRCGQTWQAIVMMEELVRKYPDYSRAYLELGQTYITVKDYAASERHLKEGIRRKPDLVQAHTILAGLLQMQNRIDEALVHHREAIRLRPDACAAHMGIGNCLLQKGDPKGAMAAFQEALRYRPDIWQAHRELGKLLAQEGRDAEALTHLQQAAHLAPWNEQIKQLLQEVEARLRAGAKPHGPPG